MICPITEGNRLPGGPVNLLGRYPNDVRLRRIDVLRAVVRAVRARHPFQVDAWIVFADHLHCVWTLPPVDDDFPNRWRLIKLAFSRALPLGERCSWVRIAWSLRGQARNAFHDPNLPAPRLLPWGIALNYPIGIKITNAELSGPNRKLAKLMATGITALLPQRQKT